MIVDRTRDVPSVDDRDRVDDKDDTNPPQSPQAVCAHCGLPAPDTTQPAFCCHGCRGAYELIRGWGLDSYYDLRDDSQVQIPSDPDGLEFGHFDDEVFLGRSAPRSGPDGLQSTELTVLGLHCAACAWLIENVSAQTPGWKRARVRMKDHRIELDFDPSVIRLSEIARTLSRIGYDLAPNTADDDRGFDRENQRLLIRIAVAGFCAANAMWIAIAIYAGNATGLDPSHRTFLRAIGTGLGVAAVVFPGRTFFVGAMAALKTKTPHMDLPVALGLLVGSVAGVASLLTGHGEIYFDSLAVLVFLLLVGRWVQFRGQHRATRAVDLMLRITPRHAHKVTGDAAVTTLPVEMLKTDDVVRVLAGESFPADGTVIRGSSLVDRSLLTGEERPIRIDTGDGVEAGAVNVHREVDVRVEAVGAESRIGQVMQSVEQASLERSPAVQMADRMGGAFVIVVSLLATGTFAYWAQTSWQQAAANATSLLIVACPCALALATPLAIAVAIGRSAKQRILIRDGGILSGLSKSGIIWFDKTGTLTEGRPVATLRWGDEAALAAAAAIESTVCHPIADAIVRESQRRGISFSGTTTDAEIRVGGILGRWDDLITLVGNQHLMQENGIPIDDGVQRVVSEIADAGHTPILIAIEDSLRAVLAIRDSIKSDAASTIRQLNHSGWEVGILSGDHPRVVQRVGRQLGLSPDRCLGGMSPEEKLQRVRITAPVEHPTTVMVGDGANDAAAIAAADVGVAVRGGAEVSLRAAPVFVGANGLASLVRLVSASRRTTRLVQTAIAASLIYNVVAVALAMTGNISSLVAAVLMPISSLTVLSLCLAWPIYPTSASS